MEKLTVYAFAGTAQPNRSQNLVAAEARRTARAMIERERVLESHPWGLNESRATPSRDSVPKSGAPDLYCEGEKNPKPGAPATGHPIVSRGTEKAGALGERTIKRTCSTLPRARA